MSEKSYISYISYIGCKDKPFIYRHFTQYLKILTF